MNEVDKDFPIPGGNSILVLKETEEKKTKAGIILTDLNPDVNQGVQHKFTGIVMAVGCDCKRKFRKPSDESIQSIDGNFPKYIDSILEVGDRIIYNSYANMTINHEGQAYLLMQDIDAYCLLPSKETLTSSMAQKKGQRPNIDRDTLIKATSE